MPRTADPNMIVEFAKVDGTILRARLELRSEGTYALDLRKFQRGRPTLKPAGSAAGTKDLTEAKQLARRELAAIAGGQATGTQAALEGPITEAEEYLRVRKLGGHMSEDTAARAFVCIERCWHILHEKTGVLRWTDVRRADIPTLVTELASREYDGATLKRNSVINHVNYLKGLFSYLVDSKGLQGSPIHRHKAVPRRDRSFVRDWLLPWEIGLLLEWSFKLRDEYPHNACHAWPEILATECYTGGREDEVLGVAASDLKLGKYGAHGVGTMRIQDNQWRTLKNTGSTRTISLWPAHAEILRAYIERVRPPKEGLLFPGRNGQMWSDLRESMSRDMRAAKIDKHITDHSMRHSFISARARMYKQIVRGGQIVEVPVHYDDIKLEVGHASAAMREVYQHAAEHPVEGWTILDYALALREYRKGLTQDSAVASTRARRSASRRSASTSTRTTGPQKARSATRKR